MTRSDREVLGGADTTLVDVELTAWTASKGQDGRVPYCHDTVVVGRLNERPLSSGDEGNERPLTCE